MLNKRSKNMGIKIKTTRAKQIIDCEGYIEGLTNGFITVSDSLTLKDIYKLINTNDYIITAAKIYGEGGHQDKEILINCSQIVSVEKYL
jgi:hypothetical protein